MSIRITPAGWRAQSRCRGSVHRGQQAHIRAARDELLDQLQVRRVVLDIEQGAQRRAAGTCGLGQCRGFAPSMDGKLWRAAEFSSNQNTLPTPTVLSTPISPPISSTSRLAHHQADARAFLAAGLLSETVERLEKLRQLFRRQSRAGVPDADANASGGVLAVQSTSTVPCSAGCI
jgi:hypothetical protein